MTENTELAVSRDKIESFLPALKAEVNEEGYIVDMETGEKFESPDGEFLTIDEIGYLSHSEDQRIVPVRDDFSEVVSELSDREFDQQN